MKLTQIGLKTLKTPGVFWDSQLPGFGLRVYESGARAFICRYRANRRERLVTIGAPAELSVDEARAAAAKLKAEARAGRDHVEEKRRRLGPTFTEFAAEYLQRYSRPHKRTHLKDAWRLRYLSREFGDRRLGDISNSELTDWHLEKSETAPYEANRALELVASFYEKARLWGAFDGPNPAKGIRANRERSRTRHLSEDEAGRLIAVLREEPNVYARNAVLLYLLTGLRKTELLALPWTAINWKTKTVRVQDTKNDNELWLPLSSLALDVLQQTPRLLGNEYIFPGRRGGHMQDFRRVWVRVRALANIEDIRLHDLRRTLGSWLMQSGTSIELIGNILNHQDIKSTLVYARFGMLNERRALEAHGEKVARLMLAAPVN